MRKIICLLLCAVIVLSLSSCSEEANNSHVALQISFGQVTYDGNYAFSTVTINAMPTGDYKFENAYVIPTISCKNGWQHKKGIYEPYYIYLDKDGYGEITLVAFRNTNEVGYLLPQWAIKIDDYSVGGKVR